MIIVKLIGGLGNQLFQYAVGRNLAHINQVPLKLDISSFENYKLHKYSLSKFNIKEEFAKVNEIKKLKGYIGLFSKFHKEKNFDFYPSILKIKDNAYLDGYWQSEKYFKDIKVIILNDLTLKNCLSDEDIVFLEKIKNANSISLHVRRGDYISNSTTNSVHGSCSLEYYKKSIDCITRTVKSPHFFIFSDDYEWVKKELVIEYDVTFAEHNNAEKNYVDLKLMSFCKHNIIANSSFSWWGAWLNQNPDKIICSPKNWFNIDTRNTKDLIPDNWIRI